jgi:hypothetical protein
VLKNLFLSVAIVAFGGLAFAVEQTVVIPTDDKRFAVDATDVVRLTGKGIAGSQIVATVDGPAKIESTSAIKQLVNGKPLIGNTVKDFDLKPTGKGKVTVTITVTSPIPNSQPTVTKFEFEVN